MIACTLAILLIACRASLDGPPAQVDGLDPAILPPDVGAPYALFSDRCSKCHSLARALNASGNTKEYWDDCVERMRRQPGSGISVEDTTVVLRFLYYYAATQANVQRPE